MKDVISILQSRIAKRLKEFRDLTVLVDVVECSITPAYQPRMHPEVAILAKQQKEDKRILAEIIKLRRVAKTRKRSNPYALSQLLEGHETEETQTAIMDAYFGER
jgi:hypothetical protein